MTLFDIAKKNVTGNFKSYLIYFVSMIFSVVIYYTFVSLQYSAEIQAAMQSSQAMSSVFMGASIVLILFVAVFIWYSNSFFTRKRKKEVGLYSLLGLRKKTIGRLLFYENLIMGAAGVAIGVVLGTLLSKLFTMIFLKLLDSAIDISFSIPVEAIINTVVVFAVLILFTSVQAYRLIYRFKLIELFQAEKEGEQAPKASLAAAALAVMLLAFSYWLVFQPMTTSEQMGRNLLLFVAALIAGTYFLFRSAIVRLLRVFQRNKSRYYRGMNVIATSQLLYRIKGNTRTLTIIALLSAVTLSAVGVGSSMYYSNEVNADEAAPFSYSYIADGGALDRQVEEILAADKDHPVKKKVTIPVIMVKADVSALAYHPTNYPPDETPVKLLAASKYNELSHALNRQEQVQLADNEAAAIRPRYAAELSPSDYEGRSVPIKASRGDTEVTVVKFLEGHVLRWSFPDMTFVVSDQLFEKIAGQIRPVLYHEYQVENQQTTQAASLQLAELASDKNQMASYYDIYREGLENAGLNIFTLGFLGLVFLAATGSIIYFKQLTEARSDKGRYDILRKIGVSRKEIRASIAKQTFFIFALPLVVGILHSSMILKALSSINLITGSVTVPIVTSMIVYILIYLLYYMLTVQSLNKIVNKS
ncbi:ABC transporter permease [Paenibacillus nasutitermitis]|uniref:ABC transporter permease n=1 Tax=Paenibacillus nasutitermitis TaxID=1652958 RepID=A0A917DT98_9BACL|nr:ABC transporter permease [Paenibacillus nasutitermitis]GGD66776.1 ABC transporter permease [Paenibacillus nasutitermitis]